jgi:hypothetical protein
MSEPLKVPTVIAGRLAEQVTLRQLRRRFRACDEISDDIHRGVIAKLIELGEVETFEIRRRGE